MYLLHLLLNIDGLVYHTESQWTTHHRYSESKVENPRSDSSSQNAKIAEN